MRKIFTTSALAVIVVAITITILSVNRSRAVAPLKLNVKDLPKHGLRLIEPSQPEFKRLRDSIKASKRELFAERAQQPFVFLENKGPKRAIAYLLKWDLVQDDGRIVTKVNSYSRVDILQGRSSFGDEYDQTVLRKDRARVFSPYSHGDGEEAGVSSSAQNSQSVSNDERLQQLEQMGIVSREREELSRTTTITVSIDGAFFDDGTFVGPNETKYYEQVSAQVSAKHDMLQAVLERLRRGDKPSDVMKYLEQSSSSLRAPALPPLRDPKPADVYNYYRKMYTDQVLTMRAAAPGDDELTLRRLFALENPRHRIKLKKLD